MFNALIQGKVFPYDYDSFWLDFYIGISIEIRFWNFCSIENTLKNTLENTLTQNFSPESISWRISKLFSLNNEIADAEEIAKQLLDSEIDVNKFRSL